MGSIAEIIFVLIIAGLFFLFRWLRPSKGTVGERVVAGKLVQLPKDKYRVLNNVTIPTPKGSSQIDHLVVSIYGIFVIETKNCKGWIYGGEHSEYWTQNIYGHKYQLYNPILQNTGHVRALRRVLKDYESLPIMPIVAFSGKAEIKVRVEEACVVYWSQIRWVINQFVEKRLSWSQVNEICDIVLAAQIKPCRESDIQHLIDIRSAREQKYDSIASGRCPRCGGELLLRSGKYGQFYGCSNYPKCKFTHQTG
ncbi:MAG: NERD domain-containing protein [Bacteroidales bacterium]|nr:NERD domain-containing protein [Bacteroidales bacterium]